MILPLYILGQKFVKFFVVFLENLNHQKDILRLTDREMLLYRESRLWGCYKSRHVTKRDVLLLATLRYIEKYVLCLREQNVTNLSN